MRIPHIFQPSRRFRPLVKRACERLPELEGDPIEVEFQAGLMAQGRHPVHAAADLRKRLIVLDRDLGRDPGELTRILIHEVFHFAWLRLGNGRRGEYGELIAGEFDRGARGELGWSSEYRKRALPAGCINRRWREYLCESFCDTAAWHYAGIAQHDEFTLPKRYRTARARWFVKSFAARRISI